jgi:protein SCO1
MRRRFAVGALALAGLVAGCGGGGDRELAGLTLDSPRQVDQIALPDVSRGGEPFEFRASDGGLLVVYFGYTNCPDVCPTTMSNVGRALDELGDDAERVSVAMVTVDPDRDAEVLADYVQSFVASGHAIATDDIPALRDFAETFGVAFDVVKAPGGRVDVIHSDHLFAVDDAGALVLAWPFGTPVDDLAADMQQLLNDAA